MIPLKLLVDLQILPLSQIQKMERSSFVFFSTGFTDQKGSKNIMVVLAEMAEIPPLFKCKTVRTYGVPYTFPMG